MSRSERIPPPPHRTGAHRAATRAHRREWPETLPGRPPVPYEPYLDGLFTYCLASLCDHDTAVAALGDALAVAERSHGRLRDPALRRPWLYALARWACLRRCPGGRLAAAPPRPARETADAHRRELAALAWPEAAGTTPDQREAIELAVRHQLTGTEIAAVLRTDPDTARSLLSRAACEVERSRTALAVVDLGGCPAVARLAATGRDRQLLLDGPLRRELVRHVDECPACRLTAEAAGAPGPWPGTATPAVLTVVEAPLPAVLAAVLRSRHAVRSGAHRALPAFDRRGFPLDGKDRAARRAMIRHRAVTTTVVAAAVAAPALALWAAYGHPPQSVGRPGVHSVSAPDADGRDSYAYRRTGSAKGARPGNAAARRPAGASSFPSPSAGADRSSGPGSPPPSGAPPDRSAPPAPGRISVTAVRRAGLTVITLTCGGGAAVRWSAAADVAWLRPSAASGTLRPGESVEVTVAVDHAAEPAGPWSGHVVVGPAGTTVTVEGQGATPPPASSTPTPGPSHTAPAAP